MLTYIEKIADKILMPIASVIDRNRYIKSVRRAFTIFTPYIIAASIFLIITSFPLEAYQNFMFAIFGDGWHTLFEYSFEATFPIMTLIFSFLIAYRLAEHYNIDGASAGVLGLISFLTITPFASSDELGAVLPLEWVGSKGMFVGILVSILTTEILRLFLQKKWVIKLPDGTPPAVATSFAAIIPGFVTMTIMILIRNIFRLTPLGTFHQLIYQVISMPIRSFGTSFIGALFTVMSISLLWSVGINSGGMVNSILRPFWLENQAANAQALNMGQKPPFIITEQFFDMIWMGGVGATLSLSFVMMLFLKSKQNKALGRLSIAPGFFNINEPVLFGVPIILNPIMLIPFNIAPIVMLIIQYSAMAVGLVARPTGVIIPWTTPPILSGFFMTGSISGAIIQVLNLVVAGLIYLPFIIFIDRQVKREE